MRELFLLEVPVMIKDKCTCISSTGIHDFYRNLPCNVKLMIEGEEEVGSESLEVVCSTESGKISQRRDFDF